MLLGASSIARYMPGATLEPPATSAAAASGDKLTNLDGLDGRGEAGRARACKHTTVFHFY